MSGSGRRMNMNGVTRRCGTTQIRRARLGVSLEVIGEMVLLALVGGFFVYLFIESLEWPLGSALLPWIAVGIGAPFWVYRVLVLIMRAREESAEIMDIGFRTGA